MTTPQDRPPIWELTKDEQARLLRAQAMKPELADPLYQLETDTYYTVAEAIETQYSPDHPDYPRLVRNLSARCTKKSMPSDPLTRWRPHPWNGTMVPLYPGQLYQEHMSEEAWYQAQARIDLPKQKQAMAETLAKTLKQIAQQRQAAEQEQKNAQKLALKQFAHALKQREQTAELALRQKHRQKKLKWFSLIAALLLVVMVPTGNAALGVFHRYHPQFKSVLENGNFRELSKYMSGDHPQNIKDRYLWAFGHYRKGEYPEATRLIRHLQAQDLDPKTEADCYYLNGLISTETHNFDRALVELADADHLYEVLDKPANRYHVGIAKAKVLTLENRLDEAENSLKEIETFSEQHLGKWHKRKCQIHLRRGEYEEAIVEAKQAVALYLSDGERGKSNLAGAYSSLGFAYALAGDLSKAHYYTTLADIVIDELDDEQKRVYNMINSILIQRMLGGSAEGMQKSVEEWATIHSDSNLLFELNFVLEATHETLTESGTKRN